MVETFFEKLDQLAVTPEAVTKVRALVIDLAVEGKLVPNDPLEDPVGLEMPEASNSIAHVPANWRVGTVGGVLSLEYGDNLPAPKRDKSGKYPVYGSNGIVGTHNEYLCREPAIIIGRKGSAGALNVSDGPSWTTDVAYFVRPPKDLNLRFTYYLLLSLHLDGLSKGIKPGLSRKEVYALSIALPPLAEQKRIVAKVDELMALCDRLEVQQYERVTRHAALTRAAVDRFNEEPTGDNLNLLFHKSYSISAADLRRAIANLALRGKLSPRGEYAESVDLLLAKLQDERHRYATKYGFRTNDPRKDKADKPYSIPNHWRWVNLSDLFYAVTDGDHLPPPKSSDGIAFLTIGNITTGQLDFSEVRYVPKHYYDALAEYRQPRNGDFLYTVVGATYGRPAPVDTTRPFCVQRHIAILKPCQSTNREFLSLLLKSPLVYEQAKASTTGTAQPTIPLGALRRFQVPLPPLSEQDRIARRVSELIALVDTMDEQLRRTEAMSEELLDAFIHLVLHPDKEVANNHKHDSASARAAIGCYAIRSLTQNASFGRTMLMKVFYLSEAHSGISQGWQPMRQAAGPYDPAIEDFESLGVQSGWFTVKTKTLGNGHEMVQYQSKSGMEAKIAEAVSVLGGQQTEFDRLLNLFQNKTTGEAEIIATLFAAWNDLLIDGKSPSDDEIIREVRENWHYKKERFTPTLLTRWLNWLRQQSVIPRGLAPRTRQQLKLGLS
jgi:type I restriction enzyme, S subunit